jgi:alkanesulfonate monooxygenase SsuD/methylene tetrahydromethanopterin reductase-like flavin-dependent oxidoreductase (luciferase family)
MAGPPVLLGVWRHPRWLAYAAEACEGWVASGLYASWEDLEAGMRMFRAKGGKRAVLANVIVDLQSRPASVERAERARVTLVCPPAQAKERLHRLAAIGFDDVLLVSLSNALEDLEPVRALLG